MVVESESNPRVGERRRSVMTYDSVPERRGRALLSALYELSRRLHDFNHMSLVLFILYLIPCEIGIVTLFSTAASILYSLNLQLRSP